MRTGSQPGAAESAGFFTTFADFPDRGLSPRACGKVLISVFPDCNNGKNPDVHVETGQHAGFAVLPERSTRENSNRRLPEDLKFLSDDERFVVESRALPLP